jgi:hypothetical protein
MKKSSQTVEFDVTSEEKAVIEGLSRKYRMSKGQLVRALLFDSGILTAQVKVSAPANRWLAE